MGGISLALKPREETIVSVNGEFIDNVFLGKENALENVIENAGVPGVGLDVDNGIPEGQLLFDSTAANKDGYICTDNTSGAAVWVKITAASAP